MRELIVILLKLVQTYGERFCHGSVESRDFNEHIRAIAKYFEIDEEVGELFD